MLEKLGVEFLYAWAAVCCQLRKSLKSKTEKHTKKMSHSSQAHLPPSLFESETAFVPPNPITDPWGERYNLPTFSSKNLPGQNHPNPISVPWIDRNPGNL